jgi:hypothetical protein
MGLTAVEVRKKDEVKIPQHWKSVVSFSEFSKLEK